MYCFPKSQELVARFLSLALSSIILPIQFGSLTLPIKLNSESVFPNFSQSVLLQFSKPKPNYDTPALTHPTRYQYPALAPVFSTDLILHSRSPSY